MSDKENLIDKQKLKDWMKNRVNLIKDHFNEAQSSEKEGTLIVLGAVIAAFDVLYEQIEEGTFDVSLDDQEGEDES